MTTKTEALKLALEALGKSEPLPTEDDDDYAEAGWRRHKQAITAIEAALAQPEPKPNTTRPCRSCGGTGLRDTGIGEAPTAICKPCDGTGQIAIAAQPEQEPLTDAERKSYQAGHNAGVAHHKQATKREWVKLNDEQYIQISDTTFHAGRGLVAFARGIEAKLKELNHE